MRTTIVGGGPGGLYTAILLRRADPSAEVVVHERNAPGATFGFGVVFSAATLQELEDADPESNDALFGASARWDPVEVRYRGVRIRAGGNRFAAISRHRLLEILQHRAKEVGVEVRYEDDVADPLALRRGTDLLVAADGVRSRTRDALAGAFRPRLDVEGSTYTWLGTSKPFEVFTFCFVATPFGPMQAHVYPYGEATSTFIVETDRATWRAAGLDATDAASLPPGANDERSIALLQELFAEDLDGHPLVGNGSRWVDWVTVRNGRWSVPADAAAGAAPVVLVGDAAHTAHFSIGSGTKLAMEDAIALVEALRSTRDVPTALRRYEGERRPRVERVQAAAAESLDWFARSARYWSLPAPQLAYGLLTRSERVDHDNLRQRDPLLVAALDRWFAGAALDRPPPLVPVPPSSTPLRAGRLRTANRLALAVADPQDAEGGAPSAALQAQLRAATAAGAGLALVGPIAVMPEGRRSPADPGLWDDRVGASWASALRNAAAVAPDGEDEDADRPRRLEGGRDALPGREDADGDAGRLGADAVRDAGTGAATRQLSGRHGGPVLVAVLAHAGPRGAVQPRSRGADLPLRVRAWGTVAASPLAYGATAPPPRALDPAGMDEVVGAFAAAAARAVGAGFGAVLVDAGHGNLLATFLSPLTNQRDDDHGGDVDARVRFPAAVVAAVRASVGDAVAVLVRFTADDRQPGGTSEDDAVAIARALATAGADVVHPVTGQTTRAAGATYEGRFEGSVADLVRNVAGVPVLAGGGLAVPADADHVVLAGRADLALLRPLPPAPAWLGVMSDHGGG